MWYFAWILGVLLACAFGIINVMWYEFRVDQYCEETGEALETNNKENT